MITKQQAIHKAEQHVSQLFGMVEQAIEQGWRIDELERTSFAKLLEMGLQLLTAFVAAHGNGDEGQEVTHQGKTFERLPKPRQRRYGSIYGPLKVRRVRYGTREGQKIEYVPLDARLGLPAGEISYVLEDWLERMCVKDAFRESVNSLVDLLGVRARVSVDTAEEHSRRMDQHAASFRASQAMPPPDEEGELLVATGDAKGVPMVRASVAAAPAHVASPRQRREG